MTSEDLCARALAKAGTMNALSKATGISRNTVAMWYRKGSQPTWTNAYKLLQFLGIKLVDSELRIQGENALVPDSEMQWMRPDPMRVADRIYNALNNGPVY